MTLDELLHHLRQSLDVDVDELYRDYQSQTGSPDCEGFLHHLYERHLIDAPSLCELHSIGEVEVTQVLEKDFDATQLLTSTEATANVAGATEVDMTLPPGARSLRTQLGRKPRERAQKAFLHFDTVFSVCLAKELWVKCTSPAISIFVGKSLLRRQPRMHPRVES